MVNKREINITKIIKREVGWVIGGYENAIFDGEATKMPEADEIEYEVYQELMAGGNVQPVRKDVRFLGKERIREAIRKEVVRQLREISF